MLNKPIQNEGVLQSWTDARLDVIKVDISVAMNNLKAPFGRHGNLQTLRGLWKQWTTSETYTNQIFTMSYEKISRGMNKGLLTSSFGSEHDMKDTWDRLAQSQIFSTDGVLQRFSRWFTFSEKSRVLIRYGGEMLAILTVLAVVEQFSRISAKCHGSPRTFSWQCTLWRTRAPTTTTT